MQSELANYCANKAFKAEDKALFLAAAYWYDHAASESTGEDEAVFREAAHDCRRQHYNIKAMKA